MTEEERARMIENGVEETVASGEYNVSWRLGWELSPKTVDDVLEMLEILAIAHRVDWLAAMERGDAPHEDVSPSEPFEAAYEIVRKLKDSSEKRPNCGKSSKKRERPRVSVTQHKRGKNNSK